MNLSQFDIVLVDLNPTRGAEQQGTARPCVVLQTNAERNYARTTLIAPITSTLKKVYEFEVFLKADINNKLQTDSKIKLDQIRVIDKARIIKKIGQLSDTEQIGIDKAIFTIFDLKKYFR